MTLLGLTAGLALLVIGAELVVRQGSALAARMRVPPFVVGVTVVSLGTSLPELAIGLNAAIQGNAGLAVGNIVGTNLVNILLVLGLAALIRAVDFERRTLRIDLPLMLGAAVLLLVLALDGVLTTADGVWLCVYGVAYVGATLLLSVLESRRPTVPIAPADVIAPYGAVMQASRARSPAVRVAGEILLLILGLGIIIVGSDVLVEAAVDLAREVGASDVLIGLTVVAIGTSAPELVTTLVATVRGSREIAIGNLLGSTVLNIALILGPTIVAAPGPVLVPDEVLAVDLFYMVGAIVVCVPAFWSHRRLGRVEGAIFVVAYLVYLAWLLSTAP